MCWSHDCQPMEMCINWNHKTAIHLHVYMVGMQFLLLGHKQEHHTCTATLAASLECDELLYMNKGTVLWDHFNMA